MYDKPRRTRAGPPHLDLVLLYELALSDERRALLELPPIDYRIVRGGCPLPTRTACDG